jgi:hypothetical protein
MRRTVVLGVVAALVASLPVSPARAAVADGVFVAPPSVTGGSAEHVVSALEESARAGLADAKVTAIAAPNDCAAAPCMSAAVASGQGRGVLVTSVTIAGSDYRLHAEILDGDGKVLAARDGACEICTYDEAAEGLRGLVAETASELGPAAAPEPTTATTGTMRVTSVPAGATVVIDGATVGVTPYEGEHTVGAHVVEVQKAGHASQSREVEVVGGDAAAVDVDLVRRRSSVSPRTMEIIGWSTLGVGAAMLISGIALLAVDENPVKGNCSGASVDADGDCEFRYDTLTGGVLLTVVGVAGAATGAGLVVFARRNRKREPASMAFGPLGLRGRF